MLIVAIYCYLTHIMFTKLMLVYVIVHTNCSKCKLHDDVFKPYLCSCQPKTLPFDVCSVINWYLLFLFIITLLTPCPFTWCPCMPFFTQNTSISHPMLTTLLLRVTAACLICRHAWYYLPIFSIYVTLVSIFVAHDSYTY
jgi:hypothetical protein